MKKFLLLLLLISISLSAHAKPNYSYAINPTSIPVQTPMADNNLGTYVNEKITTPLTQIGIPQEYIQPKIVEQGLEIVWNEWHANVRNHMFKNVKDSSLPKNYVIEILYTVDINKNISNIVVVYVPEKSVLKLNNNSYLKQNSTFYLYQYESNKFHKLNYSATPIRIISNSVDKILNNSTKKQISFRQVPYWVTFPKLGEKIKSFSGNKSLTFPEKTKRTSVVVKQGITDIDWLRCKDDYKVSEFNDIESYQINSK